MSQLKGLPLLGQGRSLPPDCPYHGEWLLQDVMFIYRPDGSTSSGGHEPLMTAGFRGADGKFCAGISSAHLASALRVDGETIFEHNRAGTLYLVRTDEVPPSYGMPAKRYVFQIGDTQGAIVIEAGVPTGSA